MTTESKKNLDLKNTIKSFFEQKLKWLGVKDKDQFDFIVRLVIFWVIMVAIVTINPRLFYENLQLDKPAERDILCPADIEIVDTVKTEANKNAAKVAVKPVLTEKPFVSKVIVDEFEKNVRLLSKFYDEYHMIKSPSEEIRKNLIAKYYPNGCPILSNDLLEYIVQLSKNSVFDTLASECRKKVVELASQNIYDENIDSIRSEIDSTANQKWSGSALLRNSYSSIIKNSIRTNCYLDVAETKKKQEEEVSSIKPIMKYFKKDTYIVHKGEIVTEEVLWAFNEIKKQLNNNLFFTLIGSLILMLIQIALVIVFIGQYDKSIFDGVTQYRYIGTLLVFFVLIFKFVYALGLQFEKFYFITLFSPLASFSILLTTTISRKGLIYFLIFWAVTLGLVICPEYSDYVIASSLACMISTLAWDVKGLENQKDIRKNVMLTSIQYGFANCICIGMVGLIDYGLVLVKGTDLLWGSFCGFLNGIITAIVVNGTLPYIEEYFAFATPTKLLELTSPDNPLQKRLAEEAPGTYQHSIAVADMASQAASAIGADALLAKVCALYHDVGKLKRPEYYTENQQGGPNKHDEKSPVMSALIITSHVTDGVEMARECGVPETVTKIMSQHHGKTLVEYFFNKQNEQTGGKADENQFRYKTDKPRTKEAAILLLADAVEASSRSLDEMNPFKIKDHVKRIVDKKEEDGQLDDANLSKREIDKICDKFVEVIVFANHKRIKYQNQEEAKAKEEKERMQQNIVEVHAMADEIHEASKEESSLEENQNNVSNNLEVKEDTDGSSNQ